MKKLVAWLPMYAAYYFGELCFQIVDRWPEGWSDEHTIMDKIGTGFFRGYQWGMGASHDLNEWAGLTLWRYLPQSSAAEDGGKK